MSVPKSFIKHVSLQLRKEYVFDNSPHLDAKKLFIGRKEQSQKFLEFLKKSSRGVFLVTGYRGMGKTSFVNKVLQDYKKNDAVPHPTYIRLTIAQNNPNELSVLKQLVSSIYDEYSSKDEFKEHEKEIKYLKAEIQAWKLILAVFVILTLVFLPIMIFPNETKEYIGNPETSLLSFLYKASFVTLLGTIFSVISLYFLRYLKDLKITEKENNRNYKLLNDLVERSFANVSEENQNSKFLNIDFKGLKASSEDSEPKKAKSYPLATAKEIEYQLTQFLKIANKHFNFVFIFDELDKVELLNGYSNIYQDLDNFETNRKDTNLQNLLRNRKQAVMNVISSLKNFFTTADARFIFIAGREMFDASLADVSDKQSPLSSIFTYTFNIESLLKEESAYEGEKNTSSLTNAIEEFLKYQICTEEEFKDPDGIMANYLPQLNQPVKFSEISFSEYFRYRFEPVTPFEDRKISKEKLGAYSKLFYLFQSFITYLAYRSNGSPKKLIKAFHEFVMVNRDESDTNKVILFKQTKNYKTDFYLHFSYYNQYRLGFINYLYKPFLIQYGRSFKLYSDNAITAVPYLFDHLIKFHPFAFSRSNLELVPELLSTNKTPSIKHDLDNIMSHLGNTHIRDTDIELFEYKFYSKSYNEIVFISRIFEEEAAAFNFTLDENYSVKLLLNDKIKELRSIFSKFHKESGGVTQQIFSIAFHNGNLGDLHFFDQEYDDAIGNYSDAIRPINNVEVAQMNIRDFITLTRNKLKIGLCFEKINSYEEALAFYSDSTQDIKRYMSYHLNEGHFLELKLLVDKKPEQATTGDIRHDTFYSSAFNDLLQITVQSFLAKIYVEEKMGLEGITTLKVKVALGEFFRTVQALEKICGRNHIIVANACMQLGKLLYFKNNPFPTFSRSNDKGYQYPDWIGKRLEVILNEMPSKKDLDKRQPFLSFAMYFLALDELLISRNIENLTPKDFMDQQLDPEKKQDIENRLLCGEGNVNLKFYFNYLKTYLKNGHENYTLNHYKYIAGIVSSLGDCILGMYNLKFKEPANETEDATININNYNNLNIKNLVDFSKISAKLDFDDCFNESSGKHWLITDVIKCYYLSAQYFEKFGRMASASFQYRKILQLFKVILSSNDLSKKKRKIFIRFLEKKIVRKALEITSQSSNRSDRHMIKKAKKMGVSPGNIQNNISNHPDSREICLFFEYIKLKLGELPPDVSKWINPNNSIATQHSRLMELDYYAKFLYLKNHKVFDQKERGDTIDPKEREYIIDYIFSMNTILRILKIYGTDYMLGYSYAAYTHDRIAAFIRKLRFLDKQFLQGIEKELETLFSGDSMVIMNENYHTSMAKDLYNMSIQLHTAGNAYKKTVKDMIYLEDDFNDNAYHFGAALDRYMLAAGVFKHKTERLY